MGVPKVKNESGVKGGQELSNVVKRWSNIVKNGQGWSRVVKDGQELSNVSNGVKRTKQGF